MPLVSAATLREYLPEIGDNTSADTELNSLIARVEAAVARYLGFPPPASSSSFTTLDQSTYTLYLDGPTYLDRNVLQLPIKPVVSITSIFSDIERRYEAGSALTLSNIDIDLVNGRLIIKPYTSTAFDRGYRAIKITFVAGYDTAAPPADLVHAICVLSSQLHRAKQTQGKENISIQGTSIKLSERTIPNEVQEILNKFKCPLLVM